MSETEEIIDHGQLFGNHRVSIVNDDATEIDVDVIRDNIEKITKSQTDPFTKVNVLESNAGTKKLYNSLKKRYEGQEDAKSKYIDPEEVWGYSLYDVVEPTNNLEVLGQLYDENSTLNAVISSRVMNTVGLGFGWEPTLKARKQIEKASGNTTKSANIRSLHNKEIDRLNLTFDSLNEEESFQESMMRAWLDYLSTGNGYAEIGRTKTGKIGYVGHVPSRLVRVRRQRDGFVQIANHKATFFRNFGDKETKDPINGDPQPNELLHFKMYSPNDSYYGVPPSVSALRAILGDRFSKEFNIDYFENKAIPRYAIILKGVKLSEASKRELISYFRNEVKGKNHGTLVIPLPATVGGNDAEIKFEKLENDVQEASFEKYRKSNRDEIITAYRVPPTKVGVFDNANLAVSRDADKTFKSQVIGPDQVIAEKRVNRIIAEFTDLFKLKFNQLDVIDEDLRSRIHDRYARIEVMTPNEIRQAIGMQPREGGDEMLPYPVKDKMEGGPGAPPGNANSFGKNPPKSGQDNGKNKSNADAVGENSERGQEQDSGNGRENKEQ